MPDLDEQSFLPIDFSEHMRRLFGAAGRDDDVEIGKAFGQFLGFSRRRVRQQYQQIALLRFSFGNTFSTRRLCRAKRKLVVVDLGLVLVSQDRRDADLLAANLDHTQGLGQIEQIDICRNEGAIVAAGHGHQGLGRQAISFGPKPIAL